MSIYHKIRGTFETLFQIGKGGKQLTSGSTDLSVVDTDGSTLVPIKVADPTDDSHATTKYWVRSQIPKVSFNFDGSSAPVAGTNTFKFGFCHTSGGVYTAGYLYYDDGTTLIQVSRSDGSRMINVSGDFSGIAGSFKDDNEYFYDTGTGTWKRVGPYDYTSEGALKVMKLDLTTANATSTSSMPANSIVVKAVLDVTTQYTPSGTTIDLGISGDTAKFMSTLNLDNDPTEINTYIKEQVTDIGASAVQVTATIDDGTGGTPTAGAATALIYFVVPLS